jgi:hypothetical protein
VITLALATALVTTRPAAGAKTVAATPGTAWKMLANLGSIGAVRYRCSGSTYLLKYSSAPGGATETVSLARAGRLARSRTLQPAQSFTAAVGHDTFASIDVVFATEAVRTHATVVIVLGPVAGECLIPHMQLESSTHTNT